jgi:hypothetical protein
MMARKQEHAKDTSKHTSGKLNQLVEWKKRPFLDKMINNETPAEELVAWCNDNGFPISLPTMYSYMKRRSEAMANGITMELLQPKLYEESMERKMDGMKKAYTKAHQQRKGEACSNQGEDQSGTGRPRQCEAHQARPGVAG